MLVHADKPIGYVMENPTAFKRWGSQLERREVKRRIYVRKVTAHGFRFLL